MKIAIGCDHAGFELKNAIMVELKQSGHEVLDVGCYDKSSSDYPDYAQKVAHKIIHREAERGILICGSGIGMNIAANKFNGIRASVCHDTFSAHQGVEHDHMNVLALGARVIGESLALDVVVSFLKASFSNEERHLRRVNKANNFMQ